MALISPKMGLAIWNLVNDKFNHDQLADDFLKLDFHDHSPGRGQQIPTEGLLDGAVTAAKLAPGANAVEDGSITTTKFAALPTAKVYKDATTACANATSTTLTFNNDRFDNANIHDIATNTERLVVPVAGVYQITASVQLSAAPVGGPFELTIYKNGTTYPLARSTCPPTALAHTVTTFARLAFNDYVLVRAFNNTGALITISAGGTAGESINDFGLVWIAP